MFVIKSNIFQPFALRFSWKSILKKKKKKFSIPKVFLQFWGFFNPVWKMPWMPWPETDNVTDLPVPIFFFSRVPQALICMQHSILCCISPPALLRHMHSRWYLKKQVCYYDVHSCEHTADHIMQWHLGINWGKKPIFVFSFGQVYLSGNEVIICKCRTT